MCLRSYFFHHIRHGRCGGGSGSGCCCYRFSTYWLHLMSFLWLLLLFHIFSQSKFTYFATFSLYIDLNESLMMQSYVFQPLENQWHRGTHTQKIGWFPPCDNISEQSIFGRIYEWSEKNSIFCGEKLMHLYWQCLSKLNTKEERKKWDKSDRIFQHFLSQ